MKVIIVGAGEVGRVSAETISKIHDVLVIERDESISRALKGRLNVSTLKGDGTNPKTLAYAIENHKADIIISAINNDASNLFVCIMAKRLKPEIKTVASITDPDYRIETEGIDYIISPELVTAEKMYMLCTLENAIDYERIPGQSVSVAVFSVKPENDVVGKVVMHLNMPYGCTLFAIYRDEMMYTETETMEIHLGDHLFIFGTDDSIEKFNALMGVEYPARNFIILGGSIVGRNVARMLAADKRNVRIIDRNEALCKEIAKTLNGVAISCADFTDPEVQSNEGVFKADATVATSHSDDTNLLMSMTAQRHNSRKVITRYFTKEYEDIFKYTGIETIIGYYKVVSNEVTRCAISDETAIINSREDGDLFFIHNVDAESAVRDRYLGDLTVPDGVRLVAIRRGNNLIYPKLDTKFLQDDSIIVFSSNVHRSELNKLLGGSSVPEV